MTTVSSFSVVDEAGLTVLADAHGNNVAFRCVGCAAPVLAVMRDHQRGSSPKNPSVCPACRARYWVEVLVPHSKLIVRRVP